MINNELPCQVPESKLKIQPVTGVDQHVQNGILEIQHNHQPTFVKTLQNGHEGLHAELGNMMISVESTEVENGLEPTSALGSQELMRVNLPLVPQHIDHQPH